MRTVCYAGCAMWAFQHSPSGCHFCDVDGAGDQTHHMACGKSSAGPGGRSCVLSPAKQGCIGWSDCRLGPSFLLHALRSHVALCVLLWSSSLMFLPQPRVPSWTVGSNNVGGGTGKFAPSRYPASQVDVLEFVYPGPFGSSAHSRTSAFEQCAALLARGPRSCLMSLFEGEGVAREFGCVRSRLSLETRQCVNVSVHARSVSSWSWASQNFETHHAVLHSCASVLRDTAWRPVSRHTPSSEYSKLCSGGSE